MTGGGPLRRERRAEAVGARRGRVHDALTLQRGTHGHGWRVAAGELDALEERPLGLAQTGARGGDTPALVERRGERGTRASLFFCLGSTPRSRAICWSAAAESERSNSAAGDLHAAPPAGAAADAAPAARTCSTTRGA